MAKKIFITGTGTDIGKTYVTSLLAKRLVDMGYSVGYYKVAISGADKNENDATYVSKISGCDYKYSYLYKDAVSPHLAAKWSENEVDMEKVKRDFYSMDKGYDYLLIEGSGGIICPIKWGNEKILLEDIIKEFSLSCVVVSDSKVGSINSTVLTLEYMKNKDIDVRGIIMNYFDNGEISKDNIEMIEILTGKKVIGKVENGDLLMSDREFLSIF